MPLDPLQWGISDAAIVVADDTTVNLWTIDGITDRRRAAERNDRSPGCTRPRRGSSPRMRAGASRVGSKDAWTPVVIDPGGWPLEAVGSVGTSGEIMTLVDSTGRRDDRSTISDGLELVFRRAVRGRRGHRCSRFLPMAGSIATASSIGQRHRARCGPRRATVVPSGPTNRTGSTRLHLPRSPGFLATGLAERRGDQAFDDTVSFWDPDGLEPRVQPRRRGGGRRRLRLFLRTRRDSATTEL